MMSNLGERFKKLRLAKDLSQEEIVVLFNKKYNYSFAKSSISLYENNKRTPEIETLKCWAEFFAVSIDYLLGMTDEVNTLSSNKENEAITKNEIRDIIAETVAQTNDETTKETIRAILRIKDGKDRQKVLQLIRMFAEEDDN